MSRPTLEHRQRANSVTHHSGRRAVVLVVIGLLLCWPTPTGAEAAAGNLDPTFGIGGRVTTGFSGFVQGRAMRIQPDGKIVVAGVAGVFPVIDFALTRYNTDGSLDLTFGSGGKVTTDLGSIDGASALAIQPNGKIIAAGFTFVGSNSTFALARYNGDGSLDSTFGSGGKVITELGSSSQIRAVAIQSDSKIVVAGLFFNIVGYGYFALARYGSDGVLDPSFGSGGVVTIFFSPRANRIHDMALTSDSKIVVAGVFDGGSVIQNFALARYKQDGSPDTAFGVGGTQSTDFFGIFDEAEAMAIQPDGKIVAAGYAVRTGINLDFALARYATDGSLDPSFGSGGKVITDLGADDLIFGLALQPDGKIVAVGESGMGNTDFAVVRYNSDGSIDTGFGVTGRVSTDFSGGADSALDVAIQSDGKIVAAGFSNGAGGQVFALAGYNGDTPTSSDLCIQDDSSGNLLLFNSTTGDYSFTNCAGVSIGGRGMLTKRGGMITLQDFKGDRRVSGKLDTSTNSGSAGIQIYSQGGTLTITDRNTTNDTCRCSN